MKHSVPLISVMRLDDESHHGTHLQELWRLFLRPISRAGGNDPAAFSEYLFLLTIKFQQQ